MSAGSATLGGAVKKLLESAGLSLPVYRDVAPPGAKLPYALVREGIAVTSELAGDFGADDAEKEVREQVQVDVIQQWKDVRSGQVLERYGLEAGVHRALHGKATGPVLNAQTYPMRVVGRTRLPRPASGPDANLVRDLLTVEVLRVLPSTVVNP